jgi:N-acetylneuraminate lyase
MQKPALNSIANGHVTGEFSTKVMRGLIAAPYTPFDKHTGDVKLDVIEHYADSLVRSGVTGAFICGTTGEGVSLTLEERFAVAERWTDVARDSLNIIVHVGDLSQRNSMALATHAKKVRAAGVAAMPAFFFKPSGAAQALEYCRPIAQAAGDVPFYYYHIPSMNGVSLSIVDMLAMAKERIPNFRGVKYTHPDLMEFQRLLAMFGNTFELAWGVDEIILGALAIGATAAVGSTYNYSAPLYRRMIAAHRAGDLLEARECSVKVAEMVAVLLKYGGVRTGKATMQMIGIDCGPPRAPIAPLTAEEFASVQATYEKLGVLSNAPEFANAPRTAAVSREVVAG